MKDILTSELRVDSISFPAIQQIKVLLQPFDAAFPVYIIPILNNDLLLLL